MKHLFFILCFFTVQQVTSQSKLIIKQVYLKSDTLPELFVANYADSCLRRVNDTTLEFTYSQTVPDYLSIIINNDIRPKWRTRVWIIPQTQSRELVIDYSKKTTKLTDSIEWDVILQKVNQLEAEAKFSDSYSIVSAFIEKNPDSYLSLWFFTHSHALYIENSTNKIALFNKLGTTLKDYSEYKQTKASLLGRKYPNIGDGFLEFSLNDKRDFTIDSKNIKNKWILLHFWSNSCVPCINEMDSLISFNNSIDSSKAAIISISLDEDKNKWRDSKYTNKINWISVWQKDSFYGELCLNYNIYSIPAFILFNKEKKIFLIRDGANELENIKNTFRENHLLK